MNALAKTILVASLGSFTCASSDGPLEVNQEFEVTGVVDGDTIDVAGVGRVRLLGIDAPESVHPRVQPEPCGVEAAVSLHQTVYRRRVRLEVSPVSSRDRYGRLLAVVWQGGVNINLHLVRQGYARVSTWSFINKQQYLQVERQARKEKRGIWSEKQCQ